MKFHFQILLIALLISQASSISAQWKKTNGPNCRWVSCIITSGKNLFAGTDIGVYHSTNNGYSWIANNTGLMNKKVNSIVVFISSKCDTSLFVATDDGIFLSQNNGKNWKAVNKGLPKSYVSSLAVSGKKLFAGTNQGVFLSSNNGMNWISVNLNSFNIYAYVTGSGNNIVATVNSRNFISNDGGTSWKQAKIWSRNSDQLISSDVLLKFLVKSDSNLIAGGADGIFLSTDNGDNWRPTNAGLPSSNPISPDPVFSLVVSNKNLFTTNNHGVFLSVNNAKTWIPINTGLNNTLAFPITISDSILFVGIEGKGVWSRNLSEIIDTVK